MLFPELCKAMPPLYRRSDDGGAVTWAKSVEGDVFASAISVSTTTGKVGMEKTTVAKLRPATKNGAVPGLIAVAKKEWLDRLRDGYSISHGDGCIPDSPEGGKLPPSIDWSTCLAHPGMGGLRCTIARTPDGEVRISNCNGGRLKVPAVQEELAVPLALNKDVVLDGELYVAGESQYAVEAMIAAGDTPRIRYLAYDAVSALRYRERYAAASAAVRGLELVKAAPAVIVRSEAELAVAVADFVKEGYPEAYVRHGRGGHGADGEFRRAMRAQVEWQAAFDVIDAKAEVADYKGRQTGTAVFVCLCPSGSGEPFEVRAPGLVEDRREFWKKYQECVGRRLTVRHLGMTLGEDAADGEDGSEPIEPIALHFEERI